jgi:hypothetical protein
MLRQPTEAAKHRLALTAEIAAAVGLAVLAIVFVVEQDAALAVVFAVGSGSFVVDAMRRVRRAGNA